MILALLNLAGLGAALFSDGIGDIVSWLALGLPVAVAGWYAFNVKVA